MFARVTTLEGTPEQIENGLRVAEEAMLPWLREETGYRGFMTFVDRRSGTALAISLWEGETALSANEERSGELRHLLAETSGTRQAGTGFYEVVAYETVVP